MGEPRTPARPRASLRTEAAEGDAEQARRQAEAFACPSSPSTGCPTIPALWAEVPLELLVRFGCVPVGREGARLVLAFGGLDDLLKVDELEFQLGRPIEAVVAPRGRVEQALKRHRGGEILLEQASEPLRLQLVADDEGEAVDLAALPAESPIVRLVDSLILGAIDRRASDIHIETKDREVLAKYRIDGVLYPALEPLDKRHHETIISRIKVMSELDIAEKRVPQDGRFRLRVKGRTIDFRVSIMPSIHGEDAVIRILDKESLNAAFRNLRLDVLGFAESDLRKLRKYITEPYGMVVVTGPTGSGKTTTLYAALSRDRDARGQDHHHRGPGRVPDPAHHAGAGEREEGPDLRARPALDPAPRPRQDHGGRGARPRDRADRRPVRAHRPPGLHHRPRQQRVRRDRPLHPHGGRALQLRLRPQLRPGPAAGARALRRAAGGRPHGHRRRCCASPGSTPTSTQDQVFYEPVGCDGVRRAPASWAAPRWRSCSTCPTASGR